MQIEKIWKYQIGKFSFALTQGLPYIPFLKNAIFDITEKGQLHRIKKKWEINQPNCAPLKKTGKPLSLKKLTSIFILIICGLVLTVISLIFENLYHISTPKSPIKCYKEQMSMVKLRIHIAELRNVTFRKWRQHPKILSLMKDIKQIEEKLNIK